MFQSLYRFYNGKKVFVTGHTGFKGSWLSVWLNKLGADVVGCALEPPTIPSLFNLCGLEGRITSIIADVRNRDAVKEAFIATKPEIVFHLAAQPLVRLSYTNPVETYETNVIGTVNVLEAVRDCSSVRVVVIVTSDKCYENTESPWGYRESDRLGGYDPYSSSKACQEMVTAAYCNSFFNPADYPEHKVAIASVRAGNVIGGGDFAVERLIPDFLRSIITCESLTIRNPRAVRPWQHVMEPLLGYLVLGEKLHAEGTTFSGAWNFGPNDCNVKSVEWIVNKLSELWGGVPGYIVDNGVNPHETNCLRLDSYKARQLLEYRPVLNIETALDLVVSWTKAYLKGEDIYNITERQIDEYETLKKGLARATAV